MDGMAIIFGIDDGDGFSSETRQILCHGHVADLVFGGQEVFQRHRVGVFVQPDELADDFIDLAVQRLKEMLWLEEVRNPVKCIIVDQNRAQQRLFSFDIVRRAAIERVGNGSQFACGFGHGGQNSSSLNR